MRRCLYEAGLSVLRVAEALDLNRTTVYNALRATGKQLRRRPGWHY